MPENKTDLWRRDIRPGILVVVFAVGTVGFALLVIAGFTVPAFVAIDEVFSEALRALEGPVLDQMALALTRMADLEVMLALTIVATVGLWVTKRRPEAVLLLATVALGTALGSLFKEIFHRARPGLEYARIPLPDSYSFPSGHALASFLFFATIAFIVALEAKSLTTRVWVAVICFVLAVGVAISRVYLGVHWFGDVLASWLLGAAWMSVTVAAYFWFTQAAVIEKD